MLKFYRPFATSILSGIAVSISSAAFLKIGGIAGAVLFSFALLVVVHYRWKLYTGVSGFVNSKTDIFELPMILLGNIAGCILMGLVMRYSQPALTANAMELYAVRLDLGLPQCLLMGIGCGFIMTAAVKFSRADKFLPLLFGVPLFIICGFLHSIADAFYISMLPTDVLAERFGEILLIYVSIVAGNFIGCNLTRIVTLDKNA